MNDVRRVLWVTSSAPGFTHQGGTIRQANLIAGLAAAAQVDLLMTAPLTDQRVRAHLRKVVEVDVARRGGGVLPPKLGRRIRSLASVLGLRPPLILRDEAENVAALVGPLRGLLGTNDYDVVIIQQLGLTPLLQAVSQKSSSSGSQDVPRWIAEIHDTPSITLAQRGSVARNARSRWLLAREFEQARQLERHVNSVFHRVIAVSEEDSAAFGEGTAVVPNGAELRPPSNGELPREPRVLFLGTLSYYPNTDGILWFCDEVLPRLREVLPEVELDVVGRDPPEAVLALSGRQGVSVHANVPDVDPFLEKARVCVIPLRFGSGTRLKALEAAAASRPVVGTSVGLAGLGFQDGRHARIEDEPEALAAAIHALLTDDQASESLVNAAREHVERHFTWAALGARYREAVLGVGDTGS